MREGWTREEWSALEARVQRVGIARGARTVLRSFSSSFFIVTRFLPAQKRRRVEMIYAGVRYPDEIVDTFPLDAETKRLMLEQWESGYDKALQLESAGAGMKNGVHWILAGFADVVREHGIPPEHYRSFLAAMRRDIEPAPFASLDDLIDGYVYGSAMVVGYFLAHVYGAADGVPLRDTYVAAGNLAIALQLTNFCRDVTEDWRRGRVYIPSDILASHGVEGGTRWLAAHAEERYEEATKTLDVFAPDTRSAIAACIDVYRSLNRRILRAEGQTGVRQSVPILEKLGVLPSGKYWRIPLAYLGGL